MAIRHNSSILEYCNTSVSALSGSVAGILGLTGLYGFIFYFLTAFMMSVSEANFYIFEKSIFIMQAVSVAITIALSIYCLSCFTL